MAEQEGGGADRETLLRMVAEIVASYVGHTKVAAAQLPELIGSVFQTLYRPAQPEPEPLEPAVPIRKSITPEHIICLEDGRKLKMLKRYLMSTYGMTPDDYRQKWGLAKDYPMVAPNYAKRRSSLAKESGLGRRQREAVPESQPEKRAAAEPTGRRRGRATGRQQKIAD